MAVNKTVSFKEFISGISTLYINKFYIDGSVEVLEFTRDAINIYNSSTSNFIKWDMVDPFSKKPISSEELYEDLDLLIEGAINSFCEECCHDAVSMESLEDSKNHNILISMFSDYTQDKILFGDALTRVTPLNSKEEVITGVTLNTVRRRAIECVNGAMAVDISAYKKATKVDNDSDDITLRYSETSIETVTVVLYVPSKEGVPSIIRRDFRTNTDYTYCDNCNELEETVFTEHKDMVDKLISEATSVALKLKFAGDDMFVPGSYHVVMVDDVFAYRMCMSTFEYDCDSLIEKYTKVTNDTSDHPFLN
ncbi:MAG: hypothetical protein ACRCX2_38900 [Paraclostridium sp.]